MTQAIQQAAERINAFSNANELFALSGRTLPDRSRIIAVTEQLRSVMFPGYFDSPAVTANGFATGYKLTRISEELECQARAVLGDDDKAQSIIEAFITELPEVQRLLMTDVDALFDGDPAAASKVDVVFSYPGLMAITVYRLAHVLYKLGLPLIPRMMTEYAHSVTGIDINAGAQIGEYFFIDHGTGVVIGETTVIGSYVKLYQGVTLGALSTRQGQLLAGIKRHPTLGNRVTVYSGASILGGDTVIGDDCLIGGNAFITASVPPRTRVSLKSPELNFREMSVNVWENT